VEASRLGLKFPEALIFWAALLPMAIPTDDKRIASMLQRARELAARRHQASMIEAVLAG
jgi:hypothetical protein